MPLASCLSFEQCGVRIDDRKTKPLNNDTSSVVARPGLFSIQLQNGIKLNMTATRRTALLDIYYNSTEPYLVFDLAADLPGTYRGGNLTLDLKRSSPRIKSGGTFRPSFGPAAGSGPYGQNYQAFSCVDLKLSGLVLDQWGVWEADNLRTKDVKQKGVSTLNLPGNEFDQPLQSGALIGFKGQGSIRARIGVSFVSAEQACASAELEVPDFDFDKVLHEAKTQWQEKLSTITVEPIEGSNATQHKELLYSSLYRAFLTPNNATGENYRDPNSTEPYFDSLYCSWDTFRVNFPLLNLIDPIASSEIVRSYIDAYRLDGWMPDCRTETSHGITQGGTNADNIVADWIIKYQKYSKDLNVDTQDLYRALLKDAEVTPQNWNVFGRPADTWKQYGFIPVDAFVSEANGVTQRSASRSLEYAFNDFAVGQVASLLGEHKDAEIYYNRSMNAYPQLFDKTVENAGFHGFLQQKRINGSFVNYDPRVCGGFLAGKDFDGINRDCSAQFTNIYGFYESSSWEYTFDNLADQEVAIKLMGGPTSFEQRLDYFFDQGYFNAGNEPSFHTPLLYHWIDRPSKSVDRVKKVIDKFFDISNSGIPGNDDAGAMGALVVYHLLGMYPIVSSNINLLSSPSFQSYTIHNLLTGLSSTVQAQGRSELARYIQDVEVDGRSAGPLCWIDVTKTLIAGKNIVLHMGQSSNTTCGSSGPPGSLSRDAHKIKYGTSSHESHTIALS